MIHKSFVKTVLVLGLIFGLSAVGLAAETKSATTKLSSDDTNFIKEVAQGGLMEVQLGKLAQEKAANEKVKQFGKKMEQDHSKANDELKKIASDKGVQLSNDLDSKHKSQADKLAKLSGTDFDKRYMESMVSDHKDVIKKFQRVSEKSNDAELKKL